MNKQTAKNLLFTTAFTATAAPAVYIPVALFKEWLREKNPAMLALSMMAGAFLLLGLFMLTPNKTGKALATEKAIEKFFTIT